MHSQAVADCNKGYVKHKQSWGFQLLIDNRIHLAILLDL